MDKANKYALLAMLISFAVIATVIVIDSLGRIEGQFKVIATLLKERT